jgi:Zn-dependent membrane protease YugP
MMMPGMYFGPDILLMIPAIIFSLWAQWAVKSAYAKYSKIGTGSRMTGAAAARAILDSAGVHNVEIGAIPGEMTDHYDPTKKIVNLSEGVYGSDSIAAVGIAAHEVGHAIQDAHQYAPMKLRHLIYPISSIGSTLSFPLILAGLVFGHSGGWLLHLGIYLFAAAVAFTIVTLPVEFNASSRAVQALAKGGYLTADELNGVRKVLRAAALTYVAAAAAAVLQLLRLLLIARGRD